MDSLNLDELYEYVKKKGYEDLAMVIKSKQITGKIFKNYTELQWRGIMDVKTLKVLWPKIKEVNENYRPLVNCTRKELICSVNIKENVSKTKLDILVEQLKQRQTTVEGNKVEENVYGNVNGVPKEKLYGNVEADKEKPKLLPKTNSFDNLQTNKYMKELQKPKLMEKPKTLQSGPRLPPRNNMQAKDSTLKPSLALIEQNEVIEYEDVDDVDDEGYLLPDAEPNDIYEPEPLINTHKSEQQKKLTSILNRPLPAPPQSNKPQFNTLKPEKASTESSKFFTLPTPPKKMLSIEEVCPLKDKTKERVEDLLYYRQTDRKGAEILLAGLENGAFLIRPSNKFSYTLSIKDSKKIFNIGVIKESEKYCCMIAMGQQANMFDSVQEMINFYLENPLHVRNGNEFITLHIKNLIQPHMK